MFHAGWLAHRLVVAVSERLTRSSLTGLCLCKCRLQPIEEGKEDIGRIADQKCYRQRRQGRHFSRREAAEQTHRAAAYCRDDEARTVRGRGRKGARPYLFGK